ncbi:MAG: DUF1127 domain-containing protein [Pararhodobacter sp.]|nr:DUF1127 domain-containing protein [Pararhodobacter sp.]
MQQLATQARTGAFGLDVARLVTAMRKAWQRRRLYNETHAQLNALSTLELADLGISRSMISRLAQEAADRGDAGYVNRR